MRPLSRRLNLGLPLALLAAGILAAPAAAAQPSQGAWSDTYTVQHACGVVELTTETVHETAFFVGSSWVRSVVEFDFKGLFTGPTGKTYAAESHQNGTFTPDTGATSGQGSFLRGAGGVLVMDAGRLVFNLADGSTIRSSARVIRFDGPDTGIEDTALCALLG